MPRVLVTGFEAYGVWSSNPTALVAERLGGQQVGNASIDADVLPVSIADIGARIDSALERFQPDVVLSLGLYPGAASLRVERVGLNVADFVRPDNDRVTAHNEALIEEGALALPATVPVHAIRDAQLDAGIPSVVSNSAGTYLCNATLYRFAHGVAVRGWSTRVGFIHVPFAPEQVAQAMRGAGDGASGAAPGQDAIASMSVDMMVEGARGGGGGGGG